MLQYYLSPVGRLLIEDDAQGIRALHSVTDEEAALRPPDASSDAIDAAKRWLDRYFAGDEPGFTPPLSLHGTPFSEKVWRLLLAIPYGQTVTYGELARRLEAQAGRGRMSAQAVGGAVGRNPVAIIVPCHRVVGAGGNLTGFGGGLPMKAALLRLEGLNMEDFHMPRERKVRV